MNPKICKFFSDKLYFGELLSDDSVKDHLLSGLDYIIINEMTKINVFMVTINDMDSAGSNVFMKMHGRSCE